MGLQPAGAVGAHKKINVSAFPFIGKKMNAAVVDRIQGDVDPVACG